MPLPQLKSERLREEVALLTTWMDSSVFEKWVAARHVEAGIFNEDIALTATSWDEIVRLRAARDNTLQIINTFEELRDNLEKALDETVEEETQLATESRR